MSATELQDLAMDEISGVDAPANGIPGWMVMKSEDGGASAAEAQLANLYAALGSATVLDGAPEAIRKAAEEVATYAEKQLTTDDEDEPLITKMKKLFKRQDKELKKALKKAGKKPNPFADDDDDSDSDGDDDNDGDGVSKAGDNRKTRRTAPADGDDDLAGAQEPDVAKAARKATRKALEDTLPELVEKSLEPVAEDLGVLREVVEKMLDRLEALEDMSVGSDQAYGQEYAVQKSAPTLRDAIMSAAMGNRVTIT